MPVANHGRLLRGRRDAFEPQDIPRGLTYFVCDAEDTGRVTTPAGAVSNYTGRMGAAVVQATGADQPAHSATAFNGRPAFVLDGTDNLRNTTAVATLGWPTGGAFEFWCLFEYTGDPTVSTQLTLFNYPVNSVNTSVVIAAVLSSGAIRPRLRVGTGAGNVDVILNSIDVSTGRHLMRGVSDGATVRLDVDGVVGTPVACVAGGWTGGPRHTIGASSSSTPGNFFTGKLNYLAMYKPLSDFYSAGLYRALNIRKG